MAQLETDTIAKLLSCLKNGRLNVLTCFSSDDLIKIYLHTGNNIWLSVAIFVTVLQGYGITIKENTIIVYNSKEPVKLSISNSELRGPLIKAFLDREKYLTCLLYDSQKWNLLLTIRKNSR